MHGPQSDGFLTDLVVFSPYSARLQQFLKMCSRCGILYDIRYNAKKGIIARTKEDRKQTCPPFSWQIKNYVKL